MLNFLFVGAFGGVVGGGGFERKTIFHQIPVGRVGQFLFAAASAGT